MAAVGWATGTQGRIPHPCVTPHRVYGLFTERSLAEADVILFSSQWKLSKLASFLRWHPRCRKANQQQNLRGLLTINSLVYNSKDNGLELGHTFFNGVLSAFTPVWLSFYRVFWGQLMTSFANAYSIGHQLTVTQSSNLGSLFCSFHFFPFHICH